MYPQTGNGSHTNRTVQEQFFAVFHFTAFEKFRKALHQSGKQHGNIQAQEDRLIATGGVIMPIAMPTTNFAIKTLRNHKAQELFQPEFAYQVVHQQRLV